VSEQTRQLEVAIQGLEGMEEVVLEEGMADMVQDKVVKGVKVEEEEVMVVEVEAEANFMPEEEDWVGVEADLATETMEVMISIYHETY